MVVQNCDGLLKRKISFKAQIATATELYVELLGFGYSRRNSLLRICIASMNIGDAINIDKEQPRN